LYMVNGDMDH